MSVVMLDESLLYSRQMFGMSLSVPDIASNTQEVIKTQQRFSSVHSHGMLGVISLGV